MKTTTHLVLKAPISGVIVPLADVPDPVFAARMVGDGVSIDPISASLTAPCDGRVVQMHAAGHAVTVASESGIEILMHIGLDTVQLKGRGFTARVKPGDLVRVGDVLIDFDADYVATHARSLLTEVVITSGDLVAAMQPATGSVTAGTDPILSLTLKNGHAPGQTVGGKEVRSEPVIVQNPSGLHARPAAMLAARAKQFSSDVRLTSGGRDVNARSVVGIMGLEIARGTSVEFVAAGPDAAEAVAALAQLVRDGLGEAVAAPVAMAMAVPPPEVVMVTRSSDPNLLVGVGASPGVSVGRVAQLRRDDLRVVETASDARAERHALDTAIEHAKSELDALEARLKEEGAGEKAAIFAAHRELLGDPDLLDAAAEDISRGRSAAYGWQQAFTRQADKLAGLRNELLAGRANDIRDVGRRVLHRLAGVEATSVTYDAGTILIAEELTPSDTASIDRTRIVGLCTTTGGALSHVAILARSLEIPLVAGIDPQALDVPAGAEVILDGTKGTLRVNPSADDIARTRQRQERIARERDERNAHAHEPATTSDGVHIEVAANIGGSADADEAVGSGADGVGLFRTEIFFLHRSTPPTDAEQEAAYRDVARRMGPDRRTVIRTLDIGGDKPVSYLPLPREDNPFLGERGIRVMLNRPELLRAQLRAILLAATDGRVAVMFPMIATLEEWRIVRGVLETERAKLGTPPIEAGIMIEVPSAALLADQFAAEVDFFSIGTNDLTQYTLAMDRGHPRLAPHIDGLAPAVLRLIDQTARAARAHGRRTAVCGGIASDPQAVPILIGLGIDELSLSIPSIPAVKAQIRQLSMAGCQTLAARALSCATAADVRALVPLETHA